MAWRITWIGISTGLVTLLPYTGPAGATLLPAGAARAVNVETDCANGDPDLAALTDGRFVVVWTDQTTLTARTLDAAGTPVGAERPLAAGGAQAPEVVALAGGGYGVAWFDGQRERVLARFVDGAGNAGPELEVAAVPSSAGRGFGGLDATRGPGDTLALAWAGGTTVELAELRRDGTALDAAPFVVASFGSDTLGTKRPFAPAVMAAADGSLLVFWVEGSAAPVVSAAGPIVGKRLVRKAGGYSVVRSIATGGEGHDLAGALAPDGGYLLAWVGSELVEEPPFPFIPAVYGRAFAATDTPRAPRFRLDVERPSSALEVVALPASGYVVAWQLDTGQPANTTVVGAIELGAEGRPRGLLAELAPDSYGQVRPALARAGNGLLLAVWEELESPQLGRPGCTAEQIRVRPFRTVCRAGICLRDRFELSLEYVDPRRNIAGSGYGAELTKDSGYFWFTAPERVEVVAKLIPGPPRGGHYWLFWGGLTDAGLRLTLRDTLTGRTKTYESPVGTFVSAGDRRALPLGAPATKQQRFVLDRDTGMAVESEGLPSAVGKVEATEVTSSAGPCAGNWLPVVRRPGLCLAGWRFEVEATWRGFAGRTGPADGVWLRGAAGLGGDETGFLFFRDPQSVELAIAIFDGRAINGSFWIYHAALTNDEFDLVIRHAGDGTTWRRRNPLGKFGSGLDSTTLVAPDCDCPAVYDPVCGRDGRSYGNACEAHCDGWVEVDPTGLSCVAP